MMFSLARPHSVSHAVRRVGSGTLGLVAAMAALVFTLPPAIFAYLTYRQFDYFRLSYYVPYEEVFAAFSSGDPDGILHAPVLSINMTSGHLLASMYTLSVEQMGLSLALAILLGLNLSAVLRMRKVCATRRHAGTAAAGGTGLLSTVAASGTGIIGCCGSGVAGGVIHLFGVSSMAAAQLAEASPLIQIAIIALFVFSYLRQRRRLRDVGLADG